MENIIMTWLQIGATFLETLFSAKSNDLICDLFMGQASIRNIDTVDT